MKIPPIRLAFGSVLWRIFVVTAIVMEKITWNKLQGVAAAGNGTGTRIALLIFCSPMILFYAFLISSIITVFLDVFARLVLRPAVGRWYNPKRVGDDFGTPISFQMASQEKILEEIPARFVDGRISKPGTMIRTDRRVWFSPFDWSTETWSMEEKNLRLVKTAKLPSRLGGLLLGFPRRLVYVDRTGKETQFIVSDPAEILAWYPEELQADPKPEPRTTR